MLAAQSIPARDHALATELVYGVLRWKYRLDDILEKYTRSPYQKMAPGLIQILRVAVYQYLFLSKIPPHAIVNEAVNQANIRFGGKLPSFVNAALRAVLANESRNDSAPSMDAVHLSRWYSHPQWLVRRWIARFGVETTRRILAENNQSAPLICRCNGLKTTLRDLFASLQEEKMEFAVSLLPGAFQLRTKGRSLRESFSYKRGLLSVQDLASQVIAPLLQARPGTNVLDACAAPGGKTAHIADLCSNKVSLTAVDSSARRLDQTRANLRRLGVKNVRYEVGDLTDKAFVSTLGEFDRILVDAPCSGLGVLRRNPEARYRIEEEDIPGFAVKQRQITRSLATLLKPGGKMVYSVCTVTREETRDVISSVLDECPNLQKDGIEASELSEMSYSLAQDGFVETIPAPAGLLVDGFFAARMVHGGKCE